MTRRVARRVITLQKCHQAKAVNVWNFSDISVGLSLRRFLLFDLIYIYLGVFGCDDAERLRVWGEGERGAGIVSALKNLGASGWSYATGRDGTEKSWP